MASERPSTFATPSPISRTAPTFWRVTLVLIPEIRLSIPSNNVLIFLETLLQGGQARLHAAVINIAAHLNSEASQQGRVFRESKAQAPAVTLGKISLQLALEFGRQGFSAFNFG